MLGRGPAPHQPWEHPPVHHPSADPDRICPETQPRGWGCPCPSSALLQDPLQSPSQQGPDSSSGKLDLFAISAACEAGRLPTFISKYKGNLTVGAQFGSSIHEEPRA